MSTREKIISLLQQHIDDIALIYLFGSRAQGLANEQSDYDIAFFSKAAIDNVQRYELAQQLAIELNADVDLVDLKSASTVLQMQVVSQGEKLFGSNQMDDSYSAQVFSMYGRLQESRQAIIQQFLTE